MNSSSTANTGELILDEAQLSTLAAIMDTAVSPLTPAEQQTLLVNHKGVRPTNLSSDIDAFAQYSGAAARDRAVDALSRASLDTRQQIGRVLWLLSTRAGTFALTGHFSAFKDLDRPTRQNVLARWRDSWLPPLNALQKGLTALSLIATYQDPACPLHALIGYRSSHVSDDTKEYPPRLPMLTLSEATKLGRFDAIIVGSGAGGGVVAAQLATAGKRVLVIEKGTYYHESEMVAEEAEAFRNLYELGGACTSTDGKVTFLAGSNFGGGTLVNYSVCLKPPYYVREEWAKQGLPYFKSPKFAADLDRVCQRIGATTDGLNHNLPNQILIEGSQKLGYPVQDVPVNAGGKAHDCGMCFTGCKDAIKNSTTNTWHRDAHAHGARFLDKTQVLRVTTHEGKATGVECQQGQTKALLEADLVVSSAGSLHTPALLQRSGLTNRNIGKHLRIHPAIVVYGFFDKEINPHHGGILTVASKSGVDSQGYGYIIEVPSIHPGLLSATIPWRGAAHHKSAMLRYRHMSPLVIIIRDKDSSGTITNDPESNQPRIEYKLGKQDSKYAAQALETCAMILSAAGAREIHTPQTEVQPFVFDQNEGISPDHPRFQNWRAQVVRQGFQTNYATAHQMGSCRLGASPKIGAVRPTGETWDIKNLYVADASLFPTASGVNPMVTTETLALHVADNIIGNKSKL